MRIRTSRLLYVGSLLLAGCTTSGPERPTGLLAQVKPPSLPTRVELDSTPFFAQRDYQCGPAALATALVASGLTVDADDLVAAVYLPALEGSLQTEMVAATRARGRLPYVGPAETAGLLAEVAGGRPVVVLQKLGVGPWPGWHYAVLIGYDVERDKVILRSGTQRRLEMSAKKFLWSWQRAGRWSMLALRPGEIPADPDPARFLEGAAGLESIGRARDAELAYQAAVERWPAEALPHLGLGNLAYARKDYAQAAQQYRAATERDATDPISRNNLAETLRVLGCPQRASALLEEARILAGDGPFAATIAATAAAGAADSTSDRPECVAW